jgi:hypothetical protein
MDDGNNGDFFDILNDTLDTEVVVKTGIVQGKTYRVMYRAINSIGHGDWSSIAYITAATTPDPPPTPSYSYVDNTMITLTLTASVNDGGLPITAYYLYVALGIEASTFDEVITYDGSSTSWDIDVGDVYGSTTIVAGSIYTFTYVAENSLGTSDDSDLLEVAIVRSPETPSAPTFNSATSNRSQITVVWATSTSQDISVTGYRLYSDMGLNGDYFLIYDGSTNVN